MAWVRRHRRHVPGSWFRTTTVRSHHRSSHGGIPILSIVIAVAVIVLLIAIF
ncbi:hypothetical protein JOF56_010733 [Kibdelosporangium banguiense]|uniref:Uncharacterized protein n=1 Tax=Kibdelosporangium banguiense TaxID=1365924 RepID=A0ABS4U121_9PSEU|nr:hypothetical protein [Kibdelosporangium banguiense]MBP2330348.1 hypothetical protein [Kibdelosporangium banguiense]